MASAASTASAARHTFRATRSMGPRCTSSRRPASTCGSPPPPRGRCADRPRESRCSASPTPATWRAASARAIPIAPAPGPSPPPAAALRGLHDAGTLEVAYGGGEPFAFRGFAELVAELDTTTTLAQHVTTNGTLLRAATWPAFAGRLGVVRLSIYDDVPWRPAAELLSSHGQRWGANLLVDAAVLPRLPARLAELACAGGTDVSLLSYVGPEAGRHLDEVGRATLAAIIADSPLPCRMSVCFGDQVAVPRLPTGGAGDCGAGRDFVSITPDRRVQSCSFHDRGWPGATADEILAAWRRHAAELTAPSPRAGCARQRLAVASPPPPPTDRGVEGLLRQQQRRVRDGRDLRHSGRRGRVSWPR
jgi:hypothetical protein